MDYYICRHEKDCENRDKNIIHRDVCYSCMHFIGRRLDMYKSKDKIKQMIYDEFEKKDLI